MNGLDEWLWPQAGGEPDSAGDGRLDGAASIVVKHASGGYSEFVYKTGAQGERWQRWPET